MLLLFAVSIRIQIDGDDFRGRLTFRELSYNMDPKGGRARTIVLKDSMCKGMLVISSKPPVPSFQRKKIW